MRLHLDCGDVIFGQALNNSFYQSLESIQYNTALRKSSIRNLVSSPCNPEDGFENYLSFTK